MYGITLVSTSAVAAFVVFFVFKGNFTYLSEQLNSLILFMSSKFSRFNGYGSNLGGGRGGYNRRVSKEEKFAMQNGGEVGGISNEGNTCFMNSVIQSLASSRELIKFIDSYLYTNENDSGEVLKANSFTFSFALKQLLTNVNGAYGARGREFSTKQLLNKMPNGPKQNFFLGYNQEDAQEFYQLVMGLVESEFKKFDEAKSLNKSSSKEKGSKFVSIDNLNQHEYISGCDQLGHLGNVYVPAFQVDPNLLESDRKAMPLNLVTPADGVCAERIGCVNCGEVGGIRYSVNSGLSLNFPLGSNGGSYYSGYTNYTLNGLLDDWSTPEIIDDVNCNRCGLIQTKQFLEESIEKNNDNDFFTEKLKSKLAAIETELKLPHIEDEAFEKLATKNMIKKTRKHKQILLSRPPALLSIHINRSVFDPQTMRMMKNSSNISFPSVLNLSKYVAEPSDINMDARLPFRKQDMKNGNLSGSIISEKGTHFSDNISQHESMEIDETDNQLLVDSPASSSTNEDIEDGETYNPLLLYNLKAVISHYGTHNYGHYICYRKFRGTWWRISDESVYVVTEREVVNCQGVFMLFYEYDDGFKEELIDVEDEEDEEDEQDEPQAIRPNGEIESSDEDEDEEDDEDEDDDEENEDEHEGHDVKSGSYEDLEAEEDEDEVASSDIAENLSEQNSDNALIAESQAHL
ncbi:uncharacterized protein KQ657_000820 [Scheffersomyces spartinae]|uniref:Ubiquitin carboxyl-terminal hydrolase n=1 Tax=Scheffersomyces spartinae TaxID=45513 RepID=A0A9P7V8N2_9ASCO|nr:uncharacterized protein KQ657_000820 [Scheffersomyces spartinae]KAG7193402.1 hypothetical protein KQ657_000820 [Scheffersomyces spartinae]